MCKFGFDEYLVISVLSVGGEPSLIFICITANHFLISSACIARLQVSTLKISRRIIIFLIVFFYSYI